MITQIYDMDDIRRIARYHGSHWFSPSSMRFFSSRVGSKVYQGVGGIFFVSSEQLRYSDGTCERRKYTVRQFNPETGDIDTMREFNEMTRSQAVKYARLLATTAPLESGHERSRMDFDSKA